VIVRLIAVDPNPREGKSDVLIYQVPEGSREMELLTYLLDLMRIEWAVIPSPRITRKLK
jgi:hypothetical protein